MMQFEWSEANIHGTCQGCCVTRHMTNYAILATG